MRRSSIPPSERQRRSRIAQLAHFRRLLRGTLSVRSRQCGKAGCCCTSGEPHISLYLVQRQNGKLRQLFISKEWEERVRQAVADYQELQKLVEELSESEWKHLIAREE
jgi:hypothetical protein